MNTEASKRIIIKIMANISALQNPMPILCVATIEAVIDEMYAPIFIFFLFKFLILPQTFVKFLQKHQMMDAHFHRNELVQKVFDHLAT